MRETDPETVTSNRLVEAGVSYRQVDYWSKRGYLRPLEVKTGSGTHRRWPLREYDVLRLMVKLQGVGVEVARSAEVARKAVESGDNRVDLGNGVILSIEDPEPEPAVTE